MKKIIILLLLYVFYKIVSESVTSLKSDNIEVNYFRAPYLR